MNLLMKQQILSIIILFYQIKVFYFPIRIIIVLLYIYFNLFDIFLQIEVTIAHFYPIPIQG